jgi:hypothetical protein
MLYLPGLEVLLESLISFFSADLSLDLDDSLTFSLFSLSTSATFSTGALISLLLSEDLSDLGKLIKDF